METCPQHGLENKRNFLDMQREVHFQTKPQIREFFPARSFTGTEVSMVINERFESIVEFLLGNLQRTLFSDRLVIYFINGLKLIRGYSQNGAPFQLI